MLAKRTVMLRGQDKTAKLIEAKVSEKWLNKTDRDIITDLAARQGLTVEFGADAEKSGLEFSEDRNEIASLDSAWNIIVSLAKKAGCIAFIKGDVLYVQPIDAESGAVYAIDYQRLAEGAIVQSNAIGITLSRDLSLSKEVTVKVESWRHKQGEAITSEVKSKPKSTTAQTRRLYQFRAPNLSKKQQDRIAKGRMKEILAHEREVDIDLPGDVAIDPLQRLRLSGTQTTFDQDYILAEVLHRFDVAGGYQMSVRGHNQDAGRGKPETVK
jgi:phage protein D